MVADLREDAVSTSLAGLPRFPRGVPFDVRRMVVMALRREKNPVEKDLILAYCRKCKARTVSQLPEWMRSKLS